jgi:hypothetical protein
MVTGGTLTWCMPPPGLAACPALAHLRQQQLVILIRSYCMRVVGWWLSQNLPRKNVPMSTCTRNQHKEKNISQHAYTDICTRTTCHVVLGTCPFLLFYPRPRLTATSTLFNHGLTDGHYQDMPPEPMEACTTSACRQLLWRQGPPAPSAHPRAVN